MLSGDAAACGVGLGVGDGLGEGDAEEVGLTEAETLGAVLALGSRLALLLIKGCAADEAERPQPANGPARVTARATRAVVIPRKGRVGTRPA